MEQRYRLVVVSKNQRNILKLVSALLLALFFLTFSVQAETEEETIDKCLADLTSKDVKIRRRAVLILCKYAKMTVYRELIPHLNDPDAKVRQSIVVGFIESRMVMRDAAVPLVRRLKDADVHTRRMVSSTLLPRLIFYLSYDTEFQLADKKILFEALKDKDATVRKNMLSTYYSLKRVVGADAFYHLLGDESSEIRLMALMKMSGSLTFDSIKPYLNKLITDKSVKIREQVLKSLGNFGREGRQFLKVMAEDKEPAIAARAMAFTRNPQYLPRLKKIILDESSSSDLVVDVTMSVLSWNADSKAFVIKLLSHSDETRRYAGLSALTRMSVAVPLTDLLKLVKDDSSRIRKIVFSHLVSKKLNADQVSNLSLSDYTDVRLFSLRYIIRNHSQDKDMLDSLYDLMLDEELQIRSVAINAVWECKAEDRYDILSQSLSDSEAEIRNLAARILLNSNDPKAKKIINDFKKNNAKLDINHLTQLNRISSLHGLIATKPANWRQQVKAALIDKNMDIKKAAIDVIVKTRDPELFNALKDVLESGENRALSDYLFMKISEEEETQ